jgi:F-type H+-transporting ATPase subunit a
VATLFLYILFANWIGILPGVGSWAIHTPEGEKIVFRSPNSDLSLTAAMAIIVFFAVQFTGMRSDIKSYFVKFLWPPLIGQLEIISEFSRPLSLALRLFGNLFAGGLMIALIGLLPWVFVSVPLKSVWVIFDMFIGLIQALIFSLLTVVYLSAAVGEGH